VDFMIVEVTKDNYTRITVSGTFDETSLQAIHDNIVAMSGHLSSARFLVDISRIDVHIDLSTPMAVINTVPRSLLQRIQKLAVLYSVTYQANAFIAEAAMVNRGLNAKFFLDESLAVEWLKGGGSNT
jgi:hypothetical protein